MIKKEKSQSTQTVPTLQQKQYKYFNFFSENLLKVDTQNFLGGTVGGTVHTLCFFLYLEFSQGNSQRNSSGALTFLYTQSFLGRNSQKNHPVCTSIREHPKGRGGTYLTKFNFLKFSGCFLMLWSSDMRYSPFKTVSLQNQVSIQPNHFSMGITMGKFPQIGFWSFHELGACQSGLVCTAELVFDSSFQGYPTCLCLQPMA